MKILQKKFISCILLCSIFLLTFNSCVKKTAPILDTLSYSALTDSSVTLTININEDGNEDIPVRGFCYGTTPTPTIFNNIKNISGTLGSMQGQLTDLNSTTTYYVRAYASNSEGTTYSNEVTFTTKLTTKHLMAYYPFSGNAIDASGKGNNGTIHGNLIPTLDRKGTANCAYQFNGTDGYIEVPSSSYLKPTEAITLSTWFYVKEHGKMFDDMIAISYLTSTYPYSSFYLCKMQDSLSFCITTRDQISTIIRSGTTLNLNQWYHAVGTYDGTVMKLYLNGHLEASAPKSGLIVYNSNPLKIGHGVNDQFLTGNLDEIRIYDKGLSEKEVLQLYNEY